MASERRHRSKKRRGRGRFGRLYAVLSLLLVIGAIVGACLVFFKVQHFEVAGNSRYTAEEIIAATGIQIEDNLYLMNKFEIARQVEKKLPYVEHLLIRRRLPDTLVITVTESQAAAAVLTPEEDWWLVDRNGKLLERVADAEGYAKVRGLTPLLPTVGTQLAVSEEERLKKETLFSLVAALEEQGLLGQVNGIDLSSDRQILLYYDRSRLQVRIAMGDDYAIQISRMKKMLEQHLTGEDDGVLDLTLEDSIRFYPQ